LRGRRAHTLTRWLRQWALHSGRGSRRLLNSGVGAPIDGDFPDTLVRRADRAMYEDKTSRRRTE